MYVTVLVVSTVPLYSEYFDLLPVQLFLLKVPIAFLKCYLTMLLIVEIASVID